MGPISEAEMVVMFMCIYNFEALHISSLNYVLSASFADKEEYVYCSIL